MRSRALVATSVGALAVALCACAEAVPEVVGDPGSPLPGLSAEGLARFEQGKALFEHGWKPEEGLGPTYVQDRCTSCHDIPSSGGSSPEGLQKFSLGCDPLAVHGGDILQLQRTPLLIELGGEPETFPAEADLRPMLVPSTKISTGRASAAA